jgi:23S rRNA (cytosine1962-C5)-methyltransferase
MSTNSDTTDADLRPLYLKRGEERRLSAGHLWVFSNEIDTARSPLTAFEPGDPVRILTERDRLIGYGYVNPHSLIAARILGRDAAYGPGKSLLVHRLQVALSLRRRLYQRPWYRLVHGEADGLPGLVVDRYGDVLVAQIGTAGMERLKEEIAAALEKVIRPSALVFKNDSATRVLEGLATYVETAWGDVPEAVVVEENSVAFEVPLLSGQKTGWFYDQAANRADFLKYVPGARVLDVFSYLGAWGLAAAKAGAGEVTCVDSSEPALAALMRSAAANSLRVTTERGDAFKVLERLHAEKRRFDVVVIDPPAFIKRKREIPKGEAAYRRLNQLAMQLLDRDGLVVSCSCSYHLSPEQLVAQIQRAGRHLDRFVQIVETGGQAPDHPIHPAIPETRYLKAFFCRVVAD